MMAPIPYPTTTMKPKLLWLLPAAGLGIGLAVSLLALGPIWLTTRHEPRHVTVPPLPDPAAAPVASQGLTESQPLTSEPESSRSEEPAPAGTSRINGPHRFGCSNRDYLERLTKMLAQGDKKAVNDGIRIGLASGQCTPFEDGEPVYIEKTDWGLILVRRPGESSTYWTFIEAAG